MNYDKTSDRLTIHKRLNEITVSEKRKLHDAIVKCIEALAVDETDKLYYIYHMADCLPIEDVVIHDDIVYDSLETTSPMETIYTLYEELLDETR